MKRQKRQEPVLLGAFEEQVMLAVIRTGADAYGMSVRRELEEVTRREVTIGSVYPTLDRLEAKTLVTSSRSAADSDAPSRRLFIVTAAGAHCLVFTRTTRDRLWSGVDIRMLLET
jgi:PadR family transcriptional regulator, regulatory protein PadR